MMCLHCLQVDRRHVGEHDTGDYPTGVKIPDEKVADLETRFLTRHGFHGTWNYTLSPGPRPATAPEQALARRATPAPAARHDHAALNHPDWPAPPQPTSPPPHPYTPTEM